MVRREEGEGNMERLTFVDEDGQVLFDNLAGFPEDIGFTIRELAENEEWETLDNIAQKLANCEQRLKYYEDLEEQGKLLKLPCAVGDIVYVKMQFGGYAEAEVRDFTFFLTCGFCVVVTSDKFDKQNIPFSEFGKTVFITQGEAVLKEQEED